ncbi:MAG: hypothetical protein WD757_08935 [Actinomycetota bacterium]
METADSSRTVRNRTWPATLVIFLILAAVVLGGYFTAGLLSVPEGSPITVGGLARVTPLSGWEVARKGGEGGVSFVRLTRGNGNLDVFAATFEGDDVGLLRRYVADRLDPEARELTVSEDLEQFRLDSGLEGVRVSYLGTFGDVGAPVEGQLTAVVAPSGTGVIFDGWSAEGLYGFVAGDVDEMIRAAEVS